MDVDAVVYGGDDREEWKTIQSEASRNVKRAIRPAADSRTLYRIMDTQEVKTIWHPVGF